MNIMERSITRVGSYAPDFELPGIDGQVHHLARYLEQRKAVGVVFICNDCPYVCSSLDNLKQIQSRFQSQDFTLIGINSNDANQNKEDSFDNMKKFAKKNRLNFPYLWDPTQDVAQSFGIERTMTAFLIDELGIIRYIGNVDGSVTKPKLRRTNYLQKALSSLLAGQEISPKLTEASGTTIKWRF
ncbi:MAG: thioredoxin family protein [Coleofasciculaceae cyanobacterium]